MNSVNADKRAESLTLMLKSLTREQKVLLIGKLVTTWLLMGTFITMLLPAEMSVRWAAWTATFISS